VRDDHVALDICQIGVPEEDTPVDPDVGELEPV
jgi:hypothetical protein